MATVSWIDNNDNWNTAADWSDGAVPGAGDYVTIAEGSPFITNEDVGTVKSITVAASCALSLADDAALVIAGPLTNSGAVDLDDGDEPGGSSLTVDGTLTNNSGANISIGDPFFEGAISSPDLVTVEAIVNAAAEAGLNSAGIAIQGSSTVEASLVVTRGQAGFGATGVLTGGVSLTEDAVMQFAGGKIRTIAAGSQLSLDGSAASISDAGGAINSALALSTNDGVLSLSAGASLTTPGGLISDDAIYLDAGFDPGGSSLTVDGTLTNNSGANLSIGDPFFEGAISSPDTVTVEVIVNTAGEAGLNPAGITIQGSSTVEGSLIVTRGQAGFGTTGVLTGNVNLTEDAVIQFAGGKIKTIAAGSQLSLYGTAASIADAGGATNSALALSTNDGNLFLHASASVTTPGSLINNYQIIFDSDASLITAGSLINDDYISIDTGGLLRVKGTLTNNGSLYLGAGAIVAGALALTGGNTTFAAGAALSTPTWSLTGSGTTVTLGEALVYVGNFSAEAATQLALNGGALTLKGATTLAGLTVSSSNGRSLDLFGATSVSGLAIAGNALVENFATATQNGGSITVGDGGSTDKAELYNAATGVWDIVADTSDVTKGADPASLIVNFGLFEKTGGTGISTIATTINNSGRTVAASGTLDFQGSVTGTGTDTVSGPATLEFDSSVGADQTIAFTGSGSVLFIGALQTFSATVSGYDVGSAGGTNDVVQLLGSWVETGFSENSAGTIGTLTLSHGTFHESLNFAGSYTSANFLVSASGGVTSIS